MLTIHTRPNKLVTLLGDLDKDTLLPGYIRYDRIQLASLSQEKKMAL